MDIPPPPPSDASDAVLASREPSRPDASIDGETSVLWFVALGGFFSRAGRLLGRFSHPFRAAGKNARGVGRAWGLRGRQPLSAVRTRTGEGGGRVQSHPAPKPGGRAQSGGRESRGWGCGGGVARVCGRRGKTM